MDTITDTTGTLYKSNKTIRGDHAIVEGDGNNIFGDDVYVWGNDNYITGQRASVFGDRNRIIGEHGQARGKDNRFRDSTTGGAFVDGYLCKNTDDSYTTTPSTDEEPSFWEKMKAINDAKRPREEDEGERRKMRLFRNAAFHHTLLPPAASPTLEESVARIKKMTTAEHTKRAREDQEKKDKANAKLWHEMCAEDTATKRAKKAANVVDLTDDDAIPPIPQRNVNEEPHWGVRPTRKYVPGTSIPYAERPVQSWDELVTQYGALPGIDMTKLESTVENALTKFQAEVERSVKMEQMFANLRKEWVDKPAAAAAASIDLTQDDTETDDPVRECLFCHEREKKWALKCGHCYCGTCTAKQTGTTKKCALCEAPVVKGDARRVYL